MEVWYWIGAELFVKMSQIPFHRGIASYSLSDPGCLSYSNTIITQDKLGTIPIYMICVLLILPLTRSQTSCLTSLLVA